MESMLDKDMWRKMMLDHVEDQKWEGLRTPALMLVLIEIREAIEAQTARLGGEQEQWDQGAIAKLSGASSAQADIIVDIQTKLKEMARLQEEYLHFKDEALRDLAGRIVALERALRHLQGHQQETAALLTELAGKPAGPHGG